MMKENSVRCDYELACMMIGRSFIPPEQIAKALGVVYAARQYRQFVELMPTEETLLKCRQRRFVLVAGPPQPLSLSDIYDRWPESFNRLHHDWKPSDGGDFSTREKVQPTWISAHEHYVPGSWQESYEVQLKALAEDEYVPTCVEYVWCQVVCGLVKKISLHIGNGAGEWGNTASRSDNGKLISVENSGIPRIRVSESESYLTYHRGLVAALKL